MRVTHVLEDQVRDRSEAVRRAGYLFDYDQLTNPDQRQIAAAYARLAAEMLKRLNGDDDELVIGLHKLKESRDCMIKSMILTRTATALGLD